MFSNFDVVILEMDDRGRVDVGIDDGTLHLDPHHLDPGAPRPRRVTQEVKAIDAYPQRVAPGQAHRQQQQRDQHYLPNQAARVEHFAKPHLTDVRLGSLVRDGEHLWIEFFRVVRRFIHLDGRDQTITEVFESSFQQHRHAVIG